jgi:hypothetical protein
VVSLILSTVMMMQNQKMRVERGEELQRKLDAIGKALYDHRILHNKLPCPSDSSLAATSANFGLQANGASDGSCSVGNGIASNINTNQNPPNVYGGGVPVRTLGLPDDHAFDPWGNQFTYYVLRVANISTNFTYAGGIRSMALSGYIHVMDESGSNLDYPNTMAAVISHGQNGHGAFNNAGVRVNNSVTNERELHNCSCDENADPALVSLVELYFQRYLPTHYANSRTQFDDVGRHYTRSFFYKPSEKNK